VTKRVRGGIKIPLKGSGSEKKQKWVGLKLVKKVGGLEKTLGALEKRLGVSRAGCREKMG